MDGNSGSLLSAVLLFQTVWKQKTGTGSPTRVLLDRGGEYSRVCAGFRRWAARLTQDHMKWDFNFPLISVWHRVDCTSGCRRDLVPEWRLYFAHSEETTACESVKVCLCSLVSYDDPQCKALPEAHVPAVQ